jgi:hypothetical protein
MAARLVRRTLFLKGPIITLKIYRVAAYARQIERGAVNRIAYEAVLCGVHAYCGAAHAPLYLASEILFSTYVIVWPTDERDADRERSHPQEVIFVSSEDGYDRGIQRGEPKGWYALFSRTMKATYSNYPAPSSGVKSSFSRSNKPRNRSHTSRSESANETSYAENATCCEGGVSPRKYFVL